MPGIETSNFGAKLSKLIEEKGLPFRVFYDHGDASKSNVGKIYSHTGAIPSWSTNLAEVDVMVVNDHDEVELLIEIEEISSLGPKKILGVLMAILLSENITFNNKRYQVTPETVFICSGRSNPKGHNATKILNEIKPRIRELSVNSDAIVITKVIYVLEEKLEEVIEETELRTLTVLNDKVGK